MAHILNIMKLASRSQCYYPNCKAEFPNGLIDLHGRWDEGTLTYNPAKLLFHLQDTHGMPYEIMCEEIDKKLNAEMTQEEVEEYNRIFKDKK